MTALVGDHSTTGESGSRRDLLGSDLTEIEGRLLAIYEELKSLCGADLPPLAHANVRAALALMHNIVSDLVLEYEHLSDLGV